MSSTSLTMQSRKHEFKKCLNKGKQDEQWVASPKGGGDLIGQWGQTYKSGQPKDAYE